MENLTLAWVGWLKLNPNCQVSSDFLGGGAPKLLITSVWTRLESLKKEIGPLWLTKKGLQRL